MLNIHENRNKTEVLMNDVTGAFKRNKRKYLVICRTGNNKEIDYVDGTRDVKFLEKCKLHLDSLIEKASESEGKPSSHIPDDENMEYSLFYIHVNQIEPFFKREDEVWMTHEQARLIYVALPAEISRGLHIRYRIKAVKQ